jgi:Zn-finger protein
MTITIKPLPLALSEIKAIEAKRSRYGCGREACVDCYPLQYSCELCASVWELPIRNGEEWECPDCEWVNNDNLVW